MVNIFSFYKKIKIIKKILRPGEAPVRYKHSILKRRIGQLLVRKNNIKIMVFECPKKCVELINIIQYLTKRILPKFNKIKINTLHKKTDIS